MSRPLAVQLYSLRNEAEKDFVGVLKKVAHIGYQAVELAGLLRLDKVVCGYGAKDFEDLDAIKRTAELTNEMQEILAKNNLGLFQHNHATQPLCRESLLGNRLHFLAHTVLTLLRFA